MQTSGLILDLYDDFQGDVLSTIYSSTEEAPAIVKQAHRLKEAELRGLPDDVFALVALVDGDTKMRKFACTDPGNTVLSVEYFLKTAHKLPVEAQKLAAENLVTACGWYGIKPPGALMKRAGVGLAIGALSAVPLAQGARDNVKKNMHNIRSAPPGTIVNPFTKSAQVQDPMPHIGQQQPQVGTPPPPIQQQAHMSSMAAQSSPTPMGGTKASAPATTAQPTPKTAEAAFTEVMPASSVAEAKPFKKKAPVKLAGCGTKRAKLKAAMMKKAEMGHLVPGSHGKDVAPQTETDPSKGLEREIHEKVFRQGLDLRDKEVTPKLTEKKAHYVALGRYPMDDFGQIKQASAYFEEWNSSMLPEVKRAFCQLLVKRADAIGHPRLVSYDARKYGSSTYAHPGEVKMAMDMRKSLLNDFEAHRVLDGLFEKMATISADVFCETLNQFDQQYGLHHQYSHHVPDPYWSTYGSQKHAAQESMGDGLDADGGDKLYPVGTEVISKNQLLDSADPTSSISAVKMLEEKFGKEFRDEYQEDPVGIFNSLPMQQKVFIARFINDNSMAPPVA